MALASTVCVFGVALALALYPLQAHPQDITQPTLLVAAPNLQGPYRGTVLFAAPGVQGVHVGLILNRPSKVRMAELFPAHAPCTEVRDPVYFGGPEMQDAIFALVRGESPHPSSLQVAPGVWLVHNGSAVDRVIEATPNAARYFAGFVVWRPGELAEELRSRYFIRQPLDVEKLFRPDTSTLYEELAPRKGQVDA
jgi:putative transcriptional regulator